MSAVEIPSAPMGIPIKQLINHARTLTPSVFEEAYGSTVLVRVPLDDDDAEEEGDDEGEWAFQTAYIHAVPNTQGAHQFFDAERSVAYLLRKARRGFFDKTILVGRASSNDICIDHVSISKLHARLRVANEGTLMVSDAGSRNGTRLNDQAIQGERAIRDGDVLTFGSRRVRVYDAQKLHGVLRSLAGRTRQT